MAVRIRMKRFGTKNRLQWRIVVSDVRSPRDGRFIEEIGCYDPLPAKEKLEVKEERLKYWLGKGAQLSTSVKSLLKMSARKKRKAA